MRVTVTGATGLIGRALVAALRDRGDAVVALSRDPARARAVLGAAVEVHRWADPELEAPPAPALEGSDAVVHLLGEPIAQRWTAAVKRRIRDSRVLATRRLVGALETVSLERRPGVLVSQSAVGYYGPRGDEELDESAPAGVDFLADVTAEWEAAALEPQVARRVVVTRTGVVLSARGGALAQMLPPFRLGLGGPVGGGRQYVSWIHLEHLLDDERAAGPVNLTAPAPVTNAELARALGRELRRPAVVPVPALALRLLYGEMAMVVLTGQRALPRRLLELGYRFRYPELAGALRSVLGHAR
jgi:uncharacterized protein (TIGR01777 family)